MAVDKADDVRTAKSGLNPVHSAQALPFKIKGGWFYQDLRVFSRYVGISFLFIHIGSMPNDPP